MPVVRKSSFRHVRTETVRKEEMWNDTKISQSSWDSNKGSISTRFAALVWSISGGGAIGIIDISHPYRLGGTPPLIVGHAAPVNDVAFCPFNPNLLASASDDGTAKLWNIPDGGLTEEMSEPAVTLNGHTHKVGCVRWHPLAEHILATAAQDQTLRIWNVSKPSQEKCVELGAYPTVFEWSPDGRYVLVACKDKIMRLIDPRTESIVAQFEAHSGMKPSRPCWTSATTFATVGHSYSATRQLSFWSLEDVMGGKAEPLTTFDLDQASSCIIPFFDPSTKILFLAGKGEGSIRSYELVDEAPYAYEITTYSSTDPQIVCIAYPKACVDVLKCEIFRLAKITRDHMEPLSFIVPRRVSGFHADLYPDIPGETPAMTPEEWLAGENKDPVLVSMQPDGVEVAEKPQPRRFVAQAAATEKVETPAEKIARLEAENAKLRALLAEHGIDATAEAN